MVRPRVLVDAGCLRDGRAEAGIGRYARELIAALSRRDDVVLEVAMPATVTRSESRPGRFVHAHPAVLRAALRWKPHVVHALGGEPVLGYPLRRQVVTVHDVELWRARGPGGARGAVLELYKRLIAPLYPRAGAIIAVSATTAREASGTLRLDPARIHVVPHGVSPRFTPVATPEDMDVRVRMGLEAPYVVWSGTLRQPDPRKGLDVLLAAMLRLGEPVSLALAGALGDEARRAVDVAAARGLRIVLCGSLPDTSLAALYRGAAALVMASRHEGFGLPLLEAMACGAPVVATSAGNLPDLAGGAALIVAPNDPEALACALRALVSDPSRAQRLRAAGLQRASQFSWTRAAEQTSAVYRELTRVGYPGA
jgi:glycosyltransferase involved in cell wall biosynthesis